MTLISVIIPTRNRIEFLKDAVASVLAQQNVNLELLIVNDGQDAVPVFQDERVKILDNSAAGAVPARNLGLAHASGDVIAFLDDDDFFIDELHLAKAKQALAKGAVFYFADGFMQFPDGARKLFAQTADIDSLTQNNTILISTVCYQRALHDKLGRFDEALPYYWDWDWYLRVARHGGLMTHGAAPAVVIRVHAQNMSGQDNLGPRQANLEALCGKHHLTNIPVKNHLDFL